MSWPWEAKLAVDGRFYAQHPTVFTVTRTRSESENSIGGDGFSVTGFFDDDNAPAMKVETAHLGNGNLRSLVLRDPATEAPLLAVEESRFGTDDGQRRWEAFRGIEMKATDRLFVAVDKTQFFQWGNTVHVFLHGNSSDERVPDFVVHGSYFWREITVSHGGVIVAQIRNESSRWASLKGNNKYTLMITPGVDQAFLLALTVILDQMQTPRPEIACCCNKNSTTSN